MRQIRPLDPLFLPSLSAALIGLFLAAPSRAEILYGTAFSGRQIVRIDTIADTVATVATTPGSPDSMVFSGSNHIIYTDESNHALRDLNLTTHSDTILSSSFQAPADLTLTPDQKSLLVSDFSTGKIMKYDFQTMTTSVFASPGGNPEGLVFDASGNLFANLGFRFGGPTGKFVAQLDPVTGTILHQSIGLDSLDGLTFDPYSHLLYATSRNTGTVYSIDPNNLANVHTIIGAGVLSVPDGLTNDGLGNLYIAVQGDSRVYVYNIGSHSLTASTHVDGILDDLAPAVGLGSPVPEPSTLVVVGLSLGIGGIRFARRRLGSGRP